MKKIFINTRAGTQRFSARRSAPDTCTIRVHATTMTAPHPPGTAMTFVAPCPRASGLMIDRERRGRATRSGNDSRSRGDGRRETGEERASLRHRATSRPRYVASRLDREKFSRVSIRRGREGAGGLSRRSMRARRTEAFRANTRRLDSRRARSRVLFPLPCPYSPTRPLSTPLFLAHEESRISDADAGNRARASTRIGPARSR